MIEDNINDLETNLKAVSGMGVAPHRAAMGAALRFIKERLMFNDFNVSGYG